MVPPDRVLSVGQIELFDILNFEQINDLCLIELLEIELFGHLTVCIYKMCLQIIYLIYM